MAGNTGDSDLSGSRETMGAEIVNDVGVTILGGIYCELIESLTARAPIIVSWSEELNV